MNMILAKDIFFFWHSFANKYFNLYQFAIILIAVNIAGVFALAQIATDEYDFWNIQINFSNPVRQSLVLTHLAQIVTDALKVVLLTSGQGSNQFCTRLWWLMF